MHVDRKNMFYSSLVVVMALFLSVGLLHMTQSTAQSAVLEQIPTLTITPTLPPIGEGYAALTITKTGELGRELHSWKDLKQSLQSLLIQ